MNYCNSFGTDKLVLHPSTPKTSWQLQLQQQNRTCWPAHAKKSVVAG